MLDDPVVVLVEEPEDLPEVFGLLLQQVVEDIELSPLDFLVIVKIISTQKLLLDLSLVQVLEVVGVGGVLDVSGAFLDHLEHCIELPLPALGVRNVESSLRSAFLPYSLNSFMSFLPSYSGQALKAFISLSVRTPS